MRNKIEILDTLITMIISFHRKYHRPVKKIVLPIGYYNSLLSELQEEGLSTIYGTELRGSTKAKSIILN